MKFILLAFFLMPSAYASSSDDELQRKFHNKDYRLTNDTQAIVQKLDEGIYEYKTQGNKYVKGESGFLQVISLKFESIGAIRSSIFLKKYGETKVKKAGFDKKVPIYRESAECKKIWLENFNVSGLLDESYPKLPDLEKRIKSEIEKENAREAREYKEKKIKKLLDAEKAELLKLTSIDNIKKFRKLGCRYLGGEAWSSAVNYASSGDKKHLLYQSGVRDLSFVAKIGGSGYVIDRGKKYKPGEEYSVPLYENSARCQKIIDGVNKKEREKLYD